MPIRRSLPRALLLLGASCLAMAAAPWPAQPDTRLQQVFHSDRVWNAVTTTPSGRVFVGFPGADNKPGPELEELSSTGAATPFPDAAWNQPANGDPAHAFVRVNSVRIGPDGALWVIDAGAPGIGKPAVKGAARAIRIDLASNTISRIYAMDGATKAMSYVDDIRFHGDVAYLTDAGEPGLIVLDLKTGGVRRVLDGDKTATDTRAEYADERKLVGPDGKDLLIHADQIEVSPDGKYLYFQPASGPMARVETRWLDDASVTPGDLVSHVDATWVATPTTGGTAIDANGTIYLSDTRLRRILAITSAGNVSTLIADPRLIWSDAMWIDSAGYLWIPATQQNLTPGFNRGKMAVHYPVWIDKMQIGAKPSPIDHQ